VGSSPAHEINVFTAANASSLDGLSVIYVSNIYLSRSFYMIFTNNEAIKKQSMGSRVIKNLYLLELDA
jgi:hypothetical protein